MKKPNFIGRFEQIVFYRESPSHLPNQFVASNICLILQARRAEFAAIKAVIEL